MKICQLVLLSMLGSRATALIAEPVGITPDISSVEVMHDGRKVSIQSDLVIGSRTPDWVAKSTIKRYCAGMQDWEVPGLASVPRKP